MTRAQAFNNLRAATKRVNRGTSIALWACLCTTIALFVTSAYWPPKGAIDPSMFSAAGFLFGFATLFVAREAILEGFGIKLTHGQTTVEVRDADGDTDTEIQTTDDEDGNT